MVLVAGGLSGRGLGRLGGHLHTLGQQGSAAELPHRGGPGQVLDDLNLYC